MGRLGAKCTTKVMMSRAHIKYGNSVVKSMYQSLHDTNLAEKRKTYKSGNIFHVSSWATRPLHGGWTYTFIMRSWGWHENNISLENYKLPVIRFSLPRLCFLTSQVLLYMKAIKPWFLRILAFSLVKSVTEPCFKFIRGQFWTVICNILSGWKIYMESRMASMDNVGWNTGRSLHCTVEQPRANTLHVKNPTFYIKHHQNASNFYQSFVMSRYTRYLLHSK